MANLSVISTDGKNTFNDVKHLPCTTPKCFKLDYKNHNHSPNNLSYDDCNASKFMIVHQNTWGISNKIDEFLISVSPNAPQVICLTEHRLQTEEIENVDFGQFSSEAAFCRKTHKHGGVCIYVSKNLQFNTINLDQYKKEKDLEICALKLHILSSSFTVWCNHYMLLCNPEYSVIFEPPMYAPRNIPWSLLIPRCNAPMRAMAVGKVKCYHVKCVRRV